MAVVALLVSACAGNDNEVHLTTTETSTGQVITSDVTTFTAGDTYHFVVENEGQAAHELMIVEPIDPGAMDMEEMDEIALYVVEEDDLEPGETFSFDFTFPEDAVGADLEFACHIAGHYEAGMHLAITVES
ncbi:MAG: hypothetical protein PVG83_01735 [Acidimicrobiia bacterium]